MPRIETRTIQPRKQRRKRTQREQERDLNQYRRKQARKARQERIQTYRADGITRCSNCPPISFCADCARINNARIYAGLIRPKEDPRPSPNNMLNPWPDRSIKSRPRTPETKGTFKVVSINIEALGGGWYLGQALLAGKPVYGRKFRSRDEARRYAVNSMVDIREGLRFEELLDD
jgi:hypothetical protein